ncbi:MAG: hypothetical protein WA996_01785 [Candidatus Promineifilaceae bacterium]
MKLKYVSIMFALLLMMVAVATVGAAGHTASQLEDAGWTCFNTGPHNWVHCMKKNPAEGPSAIPVKVFTVEGDEFLGTELLIRADLYNGQPCPQEGGGEYAGLDLDEDGTIDYYACHR